MWKIKGFFLNIQNINIKKENQVDSYQVYSNKSNKKEEVNYWQEDLLDQLKYKKKMMN